MEILASKSLLAIDPGPEESAWVVWDGTRLEAFAKQPNDQVLSMLHTGPIAIEKIASYGLSVGAEVFETCVWTGRFMQAFGAGRTTRIPRIDVKMHLCHSPRAKDANIRQALIDRFGGPSATKKGGPLYKVSGDVWAALAVGVTWWDKFVQEKAA